MPPSKKSSRSKRYNRTKKTNRIRRQRGGWDGSEGSGHIVISARGVAIDDQIFNLGSIHSESPIERDFENIYNANEAIVTYVPNSRRSRTGLGELDINCGYKLQDFLCHFRDTPAYFPKCAMGTERVWTAINDILIFVNPADTWRSGVVDATEVVDASDYPPIVYDLDEDPDGIMSAVRLRGGQIVQGIRLSELIDHIRDRLPDPLPNGAPGHPHIYYHILTSFA